MSIEVFQEFRCGGISEDVQGGRKGCIFLAQDGTAFEVAVPVQYIGTGKGKIRPRSLVKIRRNAERYYWEERGFTIARRLRRMDPDVVNMLWGSSKLLVEPKKLIVPARR